MRRSITLLFTLLICTCCASAPRTRIFDARPLEPEGFYETIYDQVRECAEKLGLFRGTDFDHIEWYVVAHDAIPGIAGLWTAPRRIYLDYNYVLNESIIRHELAHALLTYGFNTHEDPTFVFCGITNTPALIDSSHGP